MSKTILFVTGTRADFGKLEPLAIAALNAGFDVSFFVTGMHMLDRYGLTKFEVHRTKGVKVHEFLNQRVDDPQDLVLAKTVTGFSDFVTEHQPDLVVIHGDRVEALACALVCATNYIRCAHVEGGEVLVRERVGLFIFVAGPPGDVQEEVPVLELPLSS